MVKATSKEKTDKLREGKPRYQEFIPVCEPWLKGNELKYVTEAVKTGWISSGGRFVQEFEEGFSEYCDCKYGVSVNSGTAALHVGLLALGIGKDDEVIVPSFTMAACLFAILYVGAKPVFVDAEAETWNMDVDQIEAKVTKKTKAIMPVHIYGHPVDMDKVKQLARKYSLKIIEDAAEAHGSTYKGEKVGNLSDLACFSFYGNKIITTGEGGMVVTNNKKLAEECRYFRNMCFPVNGPRNYLHDDVGFNYRMTNMQAAVGLGQLERIETLKGKRIGNARLYSKLLEKVNGLQLPVEKDYAQNVYWMYGVLVDEKEFRVSRNELADKLKAVGIGTRNFFQPLHRQPLLKKWGVKVEGKYAVAEKLAETGLYLPSGSGLTKAQIRRVCNEIINIADKG